MRKRLKPAIGTVLALLLLFISVLPAHAEETQPLPTVTPIPNYKLPYPGLLPDNPLYFLKSFRDNMIGFFIGKPLDKAEFMLLQSDKQIAASVMLAEQDKIPLATTTFSQAQDMFAEALKQTEAAKKQGVHTEEMTKKLREANQKHLLVLEEIHEQISERDKKRLQQERSREQSFSKSLKALEQ